MIFRCRCFSFECKNISNLIRQTKPFKRDYKLHYIMHGKHQEREESCNQGLAHRGTLDKTVKLQIKKHKLLLRLSWKCNIFCYPEGFRHSITRTGLQECQTEGSEEKKLQFYVFGITTYHVYDSLGIINELCSQRLITLKGETRIDRTLIECLPRSF
jgi:hypothetical protein